MPRIIRSKCKKTADGVHVPDEHTYRKKKNGVHVYGTKIICKACHATLKKWKPIPGSAGT